MANTQYNTKDIGPIVARTIDVALGGLILHVFQLGLHGQFKDLLFLIVNDTVDEVTWDLICLLEDDVSESYKIAIEECQESMAEIEELYNLNGAAGKRIISIAEKFCHHLTRLYIPNDCREDALYFLSEYTSSTIDILNWLCLVIVNERLDVDFLNNRPDRFTYADLTQICQRYPHQPVLRFILRAGRQLERSNHVALAALKKTNN